MRLADRVMAAWYGASFAIDLNGNNKLDLTETWTFSCTTTVTQSVTDTGTATGHDGKVPADRALTVAEDETLSATYET